MARYIKANPKVAQFLHLENDRNRVSDGNYILWQNDMLAFGKLIDLPEILTMIGGISLQAREAREEQDGIVCRPLPTATDERLIMDEEETETDDLGTESPEDKTESEQSDDEGVELNKEDEE